MGEKYVMTGGFLDGFEASYTEKECILEMQQFHPQQLLRTAYFTDPTDRFALFCFFFPAVGQKAFQIFSFFHRFFHAASILLEFRNRL